MKKIVYYVAVSIDGFIAGANDDVSGFFHEGEGVEKYKRDLENFDTVIMGRRTYEFGYQYGLKPGQPAYPHMKHYIFSDSLTFADTAESVHVVKMNVGFVEGLKKEEGSDIYLCGGGQFSGWLLDHKLIDVVKIKLNPLILGTGVKLFRESRNMYKLNLTDLETFNEGMKILSYDVIYQ